MKNIEKYYEELMNAKSNCGCYWKRTMTGDGDCKGVVCDECGKEFLKWLNSEYKEKIKLTKFEFDIINYYGKLSKFNDVHFLMSMRNKGYFKDMNSVEKCSMTLKEILANCEVIE